MCVLLTGGIKLLILILFSLLFDFIIVYYLPFLGTIGLYFRPLLFISTCIIYLIVNNKKSYIKKYFLLFGLMYDLLFGKVYFLCLLIFYILYIIFSYLNNKLSNNVGLFILCLLMFILIRSFILAIVYSNYSIHLIVDEILYSLLLNVIYGIILCYFLGIKSKKA